MADTVALRAHLDDGVSGPARRMGSSLDSLSRSLSTVGSSLRGIDKLSSALSGRGLPLLEKAASGAFGKKAAAGTNFLAAKLKGLDNSLQQAGLSLTGMLQIFGPGLSSAAMGAAGAVAAIAGAAATAIAALARLTATAVMGFAKMSLSVAAFKETTIGAFEVMLDSQEQAGDLWKRAVEFAAKTPFQTREVIGGFKQLLARGFETGQLERIMTAAGDLSAAMGEPQAMPRIIRALGQIRGKGKLQMEELNTQLAEVGVSTAEVVSEIGTRLGKTPDEIRRMISKGAIDSQIGVDAILTVVERRYGGVMARMMTTLTGLWQQLASKPFELFNAALGDSKGGLNAFISVIKKSLGFLVDAFDPSSERGMRLVAIISFIGESLGRVLGLAVGGVGLEGIFDGILNAIEIIVPIFTGFIEGFLEGISEVAGPLLKLAGALLGLGEGATRMETIAEIFKVIGKGVAYIVIVVGTVIAAFAGAVSAVVGFFAGAVAGILALGATILAGFGAVISAVVQGIESLVEYIWGTGDEVDRGIMPTEDILGRIGAFGEQAGALLIGGIVSGIAAGVGAVVGQMAALGQSAAAAFGGAVPGLGALLGAAGPIGGFGVGGAGVALPAGGVPAPAAKPFAGEGRGGPTTNTFNLNISGAGLTPDELMARARAELGAMIENLV